MSDNVAVTPGVGANIATDDVSGAHYQRVKHDYGGDGVSVPHIAINMDWTGGTSTSLLPAYAMAFRGTTGAEYVATNNGLPINATGTSIAILDGSGNNYLSASATMNQSSGAGLFPAVAVAQYDDVSPTAITENRFGNLRMSSRRELHVQVRDAAGNERGLNVDASGQVAVVPKPGTSGGLLIGKKISAASTNATSLKASAGQVYAIYAHNTNAAVRYLKLYNKASSPTVGTDVPVLTLPVPGSTAGNGFALNLTDLGVEFTTGIAYALTTGVGDADTGAVAADEIVLSIFYK